MAVMMGNPLVWYLGLLWISTVEPEVHRLLSRSLLLFASSGLTLQPLGLQHTRLLCPPLSPGVCSNSYSLSQRCYLTILSSATPSPLAFSLSRYQSLFPISWLFVSGGQSIGTSTSIRTFNEYSRLIFFRMDWFDLLVIQGTVKSPMHYLLGTYLGKDTFCWSSESSD